MNWNTQYSHQSKLLVLHEIKSNSQLSRHARKITRNAQANVSNQKHCIVHDSNMLVRKCLQMCQRSARMWRSKTQFYRYIILLTFSHTHVTLLCTQCIPVAVQYSCHYALWQIIVLTTCWAGLPSFQLKSILALRAATCTVTLPAVIRTWSRAGWFSDWCGAGCWSGRDSSRHNNSCTKEKRKEMDIVFCLIFNW